MKSDEIIIFGADFYHTSKLVQLGNTVSIRSSKYIFSTVLIQVGSHLIFKFYSMQRSLSIVIKNYVGGLIITGKSPFSIYLNIS